MDHSEKMAELKRETPEETTFRKQLEACQSVLSTVLSAELPNGTDFHYFKTFLSFNEALKELRAKVEANLLKFPGAAAKGGAQALSDPDEAYNWMVELMDETLERVDRAVDEGNSKLHKGQKITFQAAQGANAAPRSAGQVAGSRVSQKERRLQEWLTAQTAAGESLRPQKDFQDGTDNSNKVFQGKLEHWRAYVQGDAPDRLRPYMHLVDAEPPQDQPPHPLERLLEHMAYPEWQLKATKPIKYKGLDDTPFTVVETPEQLQEMVAQLGDSQELAVDLEHHSFRSFQGFTCLMQLSDRRADFVIDVLKLRHHIGPLLTPLFADPQVVKVLHGCDWDVLWLQRDFGIYIANLFDTGQATRVLQHKQFGLASIMERYAGIKADKRYQLADWRIRPLPQEMLLYARMDTHYLLYMYDHLKNDLVSKAGSVVPENLVVEIPAGKPAGALGTVLERSRRLALKRYDVPRFAADDHLEMLSSFRDNQNLSSKQETVFAALYAWRDRTARERDESLDYILSRRQLLNIARALPSTPKELKRSLCGDTTPSLALPLTSEILEVVAKSLEALHLQLASSSARHPSSSVQPEELAEALSAPPPVAPTGQGLLHVGLQPAEPLAHDATQDTRTALKPKALPAIAHKQPPGSARVPALVKGPLTHPASQQPAASLDTGHPQLPETATAPMDEPTFDIAEPAGSVDDGSPSYQPGKAAYSGAQARDPQSESHPAAADRLQPPSSSQQPAVPDAAGPPTAQPPAAAVVLPAMQSVQSKPSAMHAVFGSGRGALTAVGIVPPKKAPSAMAGLFKSSVAKAQDQAARETAQRLRAAFAVPFPVVPTSQPAVSQNPQTPGTGAGESQKVKGEDIRAVADALRAESTAKAEQSSQPRLGSSFETLGDYLPLPISQRYPKSRGGGIRMDKDGTDREAEDEGEAGQGEDAGDGEGGGSQPDSRDNAVDEIMRQAGLESDPNDQDSDPQTSDSSAERELGPVFSRTADGSQDGKNGRSRHTKRSNDHIVGQAADERQAAKRSRHPLAGEKRSKLPGPLAVSEDRAKAPAAAPGRSSGRPRGSLEREAAAGPHEEQELEGSDAEEGATAFDYLAARAAAPGLDLDLAAQSTRGNGRGRGRGRSRGRGGAGQRGRNSGGRGQAAAPSPYSLYQLDESKMLKGGKRSAVMPRSGNRTLTFG